MRKRTSRVRTARPAMSRKGSVSYTHLDKVSVEDHVAAVAKQLGTTIKVNCYTRFEKGEGIEKRQDDLAAEVAKLVK